MTIPALADVAWREPLWLWLALYPVLPALLRTLGDRVRGGDYADPSLQPWATAPGRSRLHPAQTLRFAATVLAWALFAVALAGPRVPESVLVAKREALPQLVVVLDLSRSMTARDIAPSRLERARLELQDLLQRARQLRIGLVVYAARAHLVAPPTDDRAVLRRYLDALRRDQMPTEGSDPAAALRLAAGAFDTDRGPRALLLVSDGELPDESAAGEQALIDTVTALQQQGIRLFTLGVATTAGATLLAPQGGWLRHEGGNPVSRLQEARLRALAVRGNGAYAAVADTDAEWRELYDRGIGRLETAAGGTRNDDNVAWKELYPAPLMLAIVLLLLGHWRPRRPRPAALLPLLWPGVVLLTLLHATPVQAGDSNWQTLAHRAYTDDAFVEARRHYARVPGYAGRMGEGASAYRLQLYRDAIGPYTEAILAADNDRERADALFNLANCHYRLEDYATAIDYYRDVLRYRPQDAAVAVNLRYAEDLHEQQRRQGDGPASTRPGRGTRSARLADGTDIGRGSITLDDEEPTVAPPPLPGAGPPVTADDMINRGIRYARPAARQVTEQRDEQWIYVPTPPERIELEAAALQVDESLLWQRIFESEEGFAAPQEQAYQLPGIRPW